MTDQEILHVAADAGVDPRTVRRALSGQRPKSIAVVRAIVDAMRARGHEQEAAYLAEESAR